MYTEINEEYVREILKLSQEMFDGKIYVKCKYHPCGWDKIDLDCTEDINYKIYEYDISDGIYDEQHPYAGFSLFEIIKTVGMYGWSFVPPNVCPEDLRTVGI